MFLGNGKSRRTNANNLRRAFHPEHGLVWSDGEHVNLSTVLVNPDDITACPPTTLGQFDSVEQIAWSSDTTQCFLSVQHTRSITVWKVHLDDSQKLKFAKARKVRHQAISQGCVWHPSKPLLVILCRDQLVLVDPEEDATQKLPICTHQRITSGTWSLDGSKVIIALGLEISIFELKGSNQLVKERTIQNFPGPIRAMVPVTFDRIAVTIDLPLAQLLNQSQEDMFEATPLVELLRIKKPSDDLQVKLPLLDDCRSELKGQDGLTKLEFNSSRVDSVLEREILQRSGPIDVTALFRRRGVRNQTTDCVSESVVHQTREESNLSGRTCLDLQDSSLRSAGDTVSTRNADFTDRLTVWKPCEVDVSDRSKPPEIVDLRTLRANPAALGVKPGLQLKRRQQEAISESSQLVLVDLRSNLSIMTEDAADRILSSLHLPCILNPDLLVYQRIGHVLVVGSNTQTKAYQVALHEGRHLRERRLLDLNLSNRERPLGMCTLPHSKNLMLLTGLPSCASDIAFLPSSSLSEYQLKLRTVKLNYASVRQEGDGCSGAALGESNATSSDLSTLTLPNGGILTGVDTQLRSARNVEEVITDSRLTTQSDIFS